MNKRNFRLASARLKNAIGTPTDERHLDVKDLGGGRRLVLAYLVQDVTVANADTFKALTKDLPANSRVVAASMNFKTAVGLDVATKVGLGTVADPDAFALSPAAVAKNTKTSNVPADATARLAAAATPRITACDNAGAAAGTFNAAATITVRIVYQYVEDLPDAP